MPRTDRLFALIQSLRAARGPRTAEALAGELEVSSRTIYRDIAVLQGLRVPVEGAAGLGYVLRRGYDLPPLNFDLEEVEALRVGLALLIRSGDGELQRAAQRVRDKVDALQGPADWLQVAPWGAPQDDAAQGRMPISRLRQAIREEEKLRLLYERADGGRTARTVRPVALIYHINCVMLAAWCEWRGGFRHFRTDRIWDCTPVGRHFTGQGAALLDLWLEQQVAADPASHPPAQTQGKPGAGSRGGTAAP
ncbi:MAG: YafY family transcriptional regulator [Rhodobacteraceae bacterium]|jgi:predicted DNA-binding transcriptional regulator YafY|nr:YafY family transcriptional regulator [Paracoccaceae bacterium]